MMCVGEGWVVPGKRGEYHALVAWRLCCHNSIPLFSNKTFRSRQRCLLPQSSLKWVECKQPNKGPALPSRPAPQPQTPAADRPHPALLNTVAMLLECRQQDGYTLSAKNVAALKALFTVVGGAGWGGGFCHVGTGRC